MNKPEKIQTNENLENLSRMMATNTAASAASFLGKEALIAGDTALHTGTGATWHYNLPKSAETVELKIMNESGSTIFATTGKTGIGDHTFDWSGINGVGEEIPAGNYTLSVEAQDAFGKPIGAEVFVQDKVISFDTSQAEPIFNVGANTATYDQILQLIAGE